MAFLIFYKLKNALKPSAPGAMTFIYSPLLLDPALSIPLTVYGGQLPILNRLL